MREGQQAPRGRTRRPTHSTRRGCAPLVRRHTRARARLVFTGPLTQTNTTPSRSHTHPHSRLLRAQAQHATVRDNTHLHTADAASTAAKTVHLQRLIRSSSGSARQYGRRLPHSPTLSQPYSFTPSHRHEPRAGPLPPPLRIVPRASLPIGDLPPLLHAHAPTSPTAACGSEPFLCACAPPPQRPVSPLRGARRAPPVSELAGLVDGRLSALHALRPPGRAAPPQQQQNRHTSRLRTRAAALNPSSGLGSGGGGQPGRLPAAAAPPPAAA